MFIALTSLANPQLDTGNATNFFTNAAAAMFQQMDLHDLNGNLITITNIPIYENPLAFNGTNINYYTPAVHRILQVAANMFDATTNRIIGPGPTNYPTVFRPIFNSQNGIVSIVGYREVISPTEAFLPMLNLSDFALTPQLLNQSVNMYGVPWVIGAKKGLPNFNEFSMDNALTVSRDLQFTNVLGLAIPPWITNQIYNFSITNSFGIEAWNSYTNVYGNSLRMVASNELTIVVTNETGFALLEATNLGFGNDLSFTGWHGWTGVKSDNSFRLPLLVSTNFNNGIYEKEPPFFIPLSPPKWTATFQPHLWMNLQFKMRFVLIDTSANRVLDFVNLITTRPVVDIAAILDRNANGFEPETDSDAVWDTNFLNHVSGISKGIASQIDIGSGMVIVPDFIDPGGVRSYQFYDRLNGNVNNTNFFQCPYSPHRTIHQIVSFAANDPLVHYTLPDVMSTNGFQSLFNQVTITPTIGALTNLGAP